MISLCTFCGSSTGKNPVYKEIVQLLGEQLAKHNIRLIYGSGSIGLMKYLADAVLEAEGEVVGIIPRFFNYNDVGHRDITEIVLVDSMAERKTRMTEIADAFLTLPGGYGTLDEFFEVLTLLQLEQHSKPIWILNINGFYDFLIQQLDYMLHEGFITEKHRAMFIEVHTIEDTISQILSVTHRQDGTKS